MDAQQAQLIAEQLGAAMKLGFILSIATGAIAAGIVRGIRDFYYEYKALRRWRASRRRKAARVVRL